MCPHLLPLENYLKTKKVKEIYRGQVWCKNCREWVYYDIVLDTTYLIQQLKLDNCVVLHKYEDFKVGSEYGLFCTICNDGIMGKHPNT